MHSFAGGFVTDMVAQFLLLFQTKPSKNFDLFSHIFFNIFAEFAKCALDQLFRDFRYLCPLLGVTFYLLVILQQCYFLAVFHALSGPFLLCCVTKTSNNSPECCTLMRAITSLQASWADGRGVGACSRHHTDDEFLVGTKLHSARQDRASVQTRGWK